MTQVGAMFDFCRRGLEDCANVNVQPLEGIGDTQNDVESTTITNQAEVIAYSQTTNEITVGCEI